MHRLHAATSLRGVAAYQELEAAAEIAARPSCDHLLGLVPRATISSVIEHEQIVVRLVILVEDMRGPQNAEICLVRASLRRWRTTAVRVGTSRPTAGLVQQQQLRPAARSRARLESAPCPPFSARHPLAHRSPISSASQRTRDALIGTPCFKLRSAAK